MDEPIVFISRNKIREGKRDLFRKHYKNSLQATMDGKPDTIIQIAYENEEANEVTIVRVFQNGDGLDNQLQGADERSKTTYEYIEPTRIEIFGIPNPATLEVMRKITGSGIEVKINPAFLGGFIR